MQKFSAMFWENKVFINEKHQYLTNEILVRYLNFDVSEIEAMYKELRRACNALHLKIGMSDKEIAAYDGTVKRTQRLMNRLNEIWTTLPPYDVCYDDRGFHYDLLVKTLNRHQSLFETGLGYDFDAPVSDRTEYGYRVDEETNRHSALFELFRFEPESFDADDAKKSPFISEDIEEANDDIDAVLNQYLCWMEDVLRVQIACAELLEGYLHIRHGFLDEFERARQFAAYLQSEEQGCEPQYHLVPPGSQPLVKHTVFTPEDGKPILCDSYRFDSIGAFLYTDFFWGMPRNYLPKKCKNCGKWFLLPHGKYSDYCENPLRDDPTNTCRDVSSRKKFAEKCKTDPVWLAYQRAYKAHYARYMKKKMTNAEFEKWGVYAIDLREKMLDKKLNFEDYQRLLKV